MTDTSIAVLGGGSWGATLSDLLARNGHAVSLWEVNPDNADRLKRTRRLPTLPVLVLHERVEVTANLGEALLGRELVVCAVPSKHVRRTFAAVRESGALSPSAWAVSAAKGIENDTLKRMSEVITDEAPALAGRVAVLSGPSHAEEVARALPTAVVAAGPDGWPDRLVSLFSGEGFRVYTNPDLVGVELAGSLKNIYAVGCGICDGLGLGDNAKAALITRGLNEMVRLGAAAGAEVITFLGLAGLGDLIVTCTSRHSRNRLLGEKLGQGKKVDQALAEMTMVAEGYVTARSAFQMAERAHVEAPLVGETFRILYEAKPARSAMRDLLARPPVPEMKYVQLILNKNPQEVS